jgi:outer membrane immunogenic protein
MHRFSIAAGAAVFSIAFSQIAFAADLPTKAPVVKTTPATSWTGLYVNGGIGYGIWSADTTTLNPVTGNCITCVAQTQGGKGWLGVVGLGYDYQFVSNFVAGVFGDVNFGSLKGTLQDAVPLFAGETKEQWSWSAGARIGWLVTPDALIYLNGGYTSARFSGANMLTTQQGVVSGFSTPAVTTHGGFVGIGTEKSMTGVFGLGPGWFWRSEYRYASYDSKTLTDTFPSGANPVNVQGVGPVGNPASSITFKPQVQTVTTQLVYKFNWWR